MARYGIFVLQVPLNPNQPTNQPQEVTAAYRDQPQRPMVNGDCSKSPSGVRDSRRCLTTQHLADGRSRLQREENYEVVITLPHAFTRLQSLQLVTLMFM